MNKHYIQLEEANCLNCMRCVRICPTKAMTYLNYQPIIQEDECILCGKCYVVCNHDAKKVYSDFALIQSWLKAKEQVIISLAPSFVSVWPNLKQLRKDLLELGFFKVEETAVGANLVSEIYAKLIQEKKLTNIITTCCPSVVSLVEKYYPELTDQLAPVVSPMIAHGMLLKQQYPNSKVIFVTPCVAKQKEADQKKYAGIIDGCITMQELDELLHRNFSFENTYNSKEKWEDISGEIARVYPIVGGIVKTLPTSLQKDYHLISVDGINRVKKTLEAIKKGELSGYFIEMNMCEGSCLNGPLLSHFQPDEWRGRDAIYNNVDLFNKVKSCDNGQTFFTKYQPEHLSQVNYNEAQILDTLYLMGKTSKANELDCGMCGYETCREKAIAVLQNKADINICLPNALEKAKSISNIIIENTPNGIIVLNEQLLVQEINPAALHMLNLDNVNARGMPVLAILPSPELIATIQNTVKIQYYQYSYESLQLVIEHAIIYLEKIHSYVLILMDLSVDEAKDKIIKEMKATTLKITQEVIDKQMRTVQEIASLLGETTAQSKVALTKLMKVISEDDE